MGNNKKTRGLTLANFYGSFIGIIRCITHMASQDIKYHEVMHTALAEARI